LTRLKKAKLILILIVIALIVWVAPGMDVYLVVVGGFDSVRKLVKHSMYDIIFA